MLNKSKPPSNFNPNFYATHWTELASAKTIRSATLQNARIMIGPAGHEKQSTQVGNNITPSNSNRWHCIIQVLEDTPSTPTRMDGWVVGWLDGWLNDWMDGWPNGWLVGWLDAWLAGWMDGWLPGWGGGGILPDVFVS